MSPFLFLLAACTGQDTDDTPPPTRDPRFDSVAAQLQADLAADDAPAVSIAIYEGGEVVWAEAFGTTTPNGDVPATADTLFQLGSTTKMFTAVAMLQGVDAGEYGLDDDLTTLLPGLAAHPDDLALWQGVTPHLLASQQTGLADYVEWGGDPSVTLSTLALDDYPAARPFMNPPGRFWNYSNPNFSYAGLVRQLADGRDYVDIMHDDVFDALGMPRTTMERDAVRADGDYALGTGFVIGRGGQPVEADAQDLADVPHSAFSSPAGSNTWTTPTELMRMADFLLHGDDAVLSDALRTEITAAHAPLLSTPDDSAYGYGVFVRPGLPLESGYHPTPVWEHGGNTLQYTCDFYILPELDYAVAILSSGYATAFDASLQAALALAPGLPEPVDPPTFTVDTARFADHVGRYEGPPNIGELIIEEQDGGLVWTLPSLDAVDYPYQAELQTVSSTLFIGTIDGAGYDITFVGEPGSPSGFIRNRNFVGVRYEPSTLTRRESDHRVGIRPVLLGPAPLR